MTAPPALDQLERSLRCRVGGGDVAPDLISLRQDRRYLLVDLLQRRRRLLAVHTARRCWLTTLFTDEAIFECTW